ncbi:MAG: hypothetical protein OEV06_05520, partial [Anaerolineae bacterium]|nr:hypothetical protein [Anaerolineae bacterium]
SEDEVIDTLDVAERAQLLSELSGKSGGIFSFAHALIPTALISGLSGLRQRRLHQKALLAVEDLHPNDFSSLAHHAAESGEVEKTLEYAEKAGDAAAGLFAWEEAQFQYHRAIEAADDLDQNEHLSKLYESAGTAFVSQGLLLKAAEMFEKAAHQTELPDRKVELNSQVGTWYSFVGDKRGFPLLEEARRELNPKTQPLPLANTLMWIGRYHHMNGHHQQAIASLADAQKVADKLDDPLLQGRIYVNTAGAYQSLSQFEESDKLAQRAVDLGDDTNTPFLKAVGYEYFAENAYARGLWQASLDYAHQELEIASQIGDQNRLGWTQLCLTLGYFGLGKLSRSEQEALKGIALAEEIGDLRLRSLLKARYIEVIAQTGDYEEIEKYGRKAARQAEELGQIFMIGRINISRAINHLLHQEWQLALDLIGLIQKGLEGKDNRWIPQDADPVHAEALWGLGKLDEAAKLAETSYQFALETKAVHHQANLQRVLAQVAFSREEYAQALEHADLAIQAAASENYRLRWGRSLFWKAKILLTLEKSTEAKTAAQEALELFEFCGAQPDIDRTQNLLNTL